MMLIVAFANPLAAQPNQWTWVSGSNFSDQQGSYGTIGIANASNVPGARYMGVSWTGTPGELWLFGGSIRNGSGNVVLGNDLWKWDGTNWAWMSGSTTGNQVGIYGTKGVANLSNRPGSRGQGVSWKDASGNFWLFGGFGYGAGTGGYINDLWRWDGTNWTWISGTSTVNPSGIYGTKGVANAANAPGGRRSSLSWVDGSGNFWLMGGYGYDGAGTLGYLNDLWRWNGTTWTWISGSNVVNQAGNYGTKGVTNAANVPGSREDATYWVDGSGNPWIFGGYGYNGSGVLNRLNDLWRWDGANWTWINGTSTGNVNGIYGTRGVASSSNMPGSRSGMVSWKDNDGNFWLFGGTGDAESAGGPLNGLWFWNGTQWTWAAGSKEISITGVYGTLNTPAASNMPGSRHNGIAWTDASGRFWLMGGLGMDAISGTARLNDLWMVEPSTLITLPLRLQTFTGNKISTGNLLEWTTADEINTEKFIIEKSENGTDFVAIREVPANGTGNGAYSYIHTLTWRGRIFYRLKMIDRNQEFSYSQIISLSHKGSVAVSYFPNPVGGSLSLRVLNNDLLGTRADLYDVTGKIIQHILLDKTVTTINFQKLPAGLYLLKLADGSSYPLIKQ
ncbi:MAG: T9SS type A sorting domain-containing protein [Chitinophagaceae bacterium]|nr:T9SS type A sorting domain-containing protein [Chitinophagaceae bacterium]